MMYINDIKGEMVLKKQKILIYIIIIIGILIRIIGISNIPNALNNDEASSRI